MKDEFGNDIIEDSGSVDEFGNPIIQEDGSGKNKKPREASLLSPKTVLPATVDAFSNFKNKASANSNLSSNLNNANPLAGTNPMDASSTADLFLSPASDIGGAVFRVAGSLAPITRGKTTDQATGQERTRTFTEAIQNPAGSLTTPIDESVDKSNLPIPVKMLLHIGTGVAQGAALGFVEGGIKGITGKVIKPVTEPIGNAAKSVGEKLQNFRLNPSGSDMRNGYLNKTVIDYGLNQGSVPEAYKKVEDSFKVMSSDLKSELLSDGKQANLQKAFDNARAKINEQEYGDRNVARKEKLLNALADYENNFRKHLSGSSSEPRVVGNITTNELMDGLKNGTIIGPKDLPDGKVGYVYSGAGDSKTIPSVDLVRANDLKIGIGEETAFQNSGGKAKFDEDASIKEQVANILYANMKKEIDDLGTDKAKKINKMFSELIPVRNVLLRNLNKEELSKLNPGMASSNSGIRTGIVKYLLRGSSGTASNAFTKAGNVILTPPSIKFTGGLKGSLAAGARDVEQRNNKNPPSNMQELEGWMKR